MKLQFLFSCADIKSVLYRISSWDHAAYGHRFSVVPGGYFDSASPVGRMDDLTFSDVHGDVVDLAAAGVE